MNQAAARFFKLAIAYGCSVAIANLKILTTSGNADSFIWLLEPLKNPTRGFKKVLSETQKVIHLAEYRDNDDILEQDYFID